MSIDDSVLVGAVMRPDPMRIDGLSTVAEALRLMKEHDLRALVIDKRDESDEYGVLSINSIANEVIAKNRVLSRVSVYEAMVKPALVLPKTMKARYALRLLTRLDERRALVKDETGLVGLVDLRQLVLGLAQ